MLMLNQKWGRLLTLVIQKKGADSKAAQLLGIISIKAEVDKVNNIALEREKE
jgi:hypothetical protein